MQQPIDTIVRDSREKRMLTSPQRTLGQMIALLEAMPRTSTDHRGTEWPKRVWFDFGRTYPVDLTSWRGSYAELALTFDYSGGIISRPGGPRTASEYPTADQLLEKLKAAVGATFQGYKGGGFIMSEDTPVWVAQRGDSGNTGVVGIRDPGYEVVIDTAWCEF